MARIALIDCKTLPEPDVDRDLLLEACEDRGHEAAWLAWDADPDLSGWDAALVRATWNYHLHPEEFRGWMAKADGQTLLLNPKSAMQGNTHKRYLLDLDVPTVPTELVMQGSEAGAMVEGRYVVKPAIGASSWKTRVCETAAEAQANAKELATEGDVLVQPFVNSVTDGGERSLIWIDGEFTHKITKTPRFEEDEEKVSQAQELAAEERQLGRQALAEIEGLLYARVDIMRMDDGSDALNELELIEPSLFLLQNPAAAERLVAGVERRLS